MKRVILFLLVLVLLSILFLMIKSEDPYPTLINRERKGYWVMGEYLHRRNIPLRPWRKALGRFPSPSLLIIAYPLRSALTGEDREALLKYVKNGNHLVVLFKPGFLFTADPPEIIPGLGYEVQKASPVKLNSYREWRDYNLKGEDLYPVGSLHGLTLVETAPPCSFTGAQPFFILLAAREGGVRAQTREMGKGRVTLFMDASIFDNAHFGSADNADYLETFLAKYLPPGAPILFDEWHHGEVTQALSGVTERIFNFILIHLVLLYLLALLILRRRFTSPPAPVGRSTYSFVDFIRSLARIHKKAGHENGVKGALLPILDKLTGGRAREIIGPYKSSSFLHLMQSISISKEDSYES